MEICNGDGCCLLRINNSNNFEKKKNIDCSYYCKPTKCPNYMECHNICPQCELDAWDGICCYCEVFLEKQHEKKYLSRPRTR